MRLIDLKIKNLPIWILSSILIFIPIEYICDPQFGISALRISQEQFFQVSAIVLFAVFGLRNVFMALFLLWALFLYGFYSFPSPSGSILLSIFSGCLIYEAAYRVVNKDNVKTLFNFLIYFAIFNVAYIAMQLNGWELMFMEFTRPGFQSQPVGFMALKCVMGMALALAIPFMAMRSPFVSLLMFVPIALSESSCAVAGAVVSYLWVLWHKSRKTFWIFTIVLVIAGSAYVIKDSKAGMMTDRANMWKVALRDAVKKPLTGFGLDSFRAITPDKQWMYWKNVRTLNTTAIDVKDTIEWSNTGNYNERKYPDIKKEDILDPWDNPHNEFIQLFFEMGFFPVILLGFFIYDIKKRYNNFDENLIQMMGFFVCLIFLCVGQFPFHLARIGVQIPVILGAYYKLTEREVQNA